MRCTIVSVCLIGSIVPAQRCAGAETTAPYINGQFQGRIAYSSDGNHNDPDDWAASPVALAIIAASGATDRLVHFDYNCILPKTYATWEKTHADSVLGAAERYGFDKAVFHDCRKDLKGAVVSIAKAVNDSSADNPLYFIVAGPMEVPVLGIKQSDPAKRKFVYCISHSAWNDGFAAKYSFTHTKRSVIDLGVHWVQIRDQNALLSKSQYGRPARPEEFQAYHWMRDSDDAKVRFLWERMQASTRPDPSDAGMAYFLLTGDEQCDPAKLRKLLDGKVKPEPVRMRTAVRLEAENFAHLEGYELEYRNDRTASHRVCVKPAGKDTGRIRTSFYKPYAATRGRYDVEVRFFDDDKGRGRYTLNVNGTARGAAWEAAGKGQGWTTHTLRDVEITSGDEIAVEAKGAPGRLDYVQLNYQGPPGNEPARPASLTVGVVQMVLEPTLAENRDKIIRFVGQAKAKGCRVVVFPETALSSPPDTPRAAIEAAAAEVRKAADAHDMYVLCCGHFRRTDGDRPNERLLVIDPDGRVIHTYDKLWADARFNSVPGLFAIDGIPCAATLCADRWIRGVEDLPAAKGAQILFECSNNFGQEWLPELGWYWYAPRAVRNQAFVVFANTAKENRAAAHSGHGHSAVFDPDGGLVVSAAGESDRLLVATLNPAKATRARVIERRTHPLFRPFWDVGLSILDGGKEPEPAFEPLRSPKAAVTLAAAQMPCSRTIADNVARMKSLIRDARAKEADVVAFPELAVTGARAEDITGADEPALRAVLAELQAAAKAEQITVVFGMPYREGGRRYNGAFVIGPDGTLLTRYAQIVVDRPDLFAPGTSTKAMWFKVKGVPAVVTVGRDALWSEIAELAAVRGAQLHVHLAYDQDVSKAGTLFRKQVWANLASFRTFTATVNAAAPDGLTAPSAPANGGSALWEDYHRSSTGKVGGYAPYSAVRVAEAGAGSQLLTATLTVPVLNPHLGRLTGNTNPQMRAWYLAGAAAIASDTPTGR